ncbi:hypothetical protein [Streptomyces canus]|uniref:hypothetical protein n=1 Tax=Streptomyces canus TaxID=58343 RepID=UPI00371DB8BB
MPAAHVCGNVVINGTFRAGGAVVLMERFTPGEMLRLIDARSATKSEGVSAMYATTLADPVLEPAADGRPLLRRPGPSHQGWDRRAHH